MAGRSIAGSPASVRQQRTVIIAYEAAVALPNAHSRKRLCSYAPATIRLVPDLDATESKMLSIVILGRIFTQGRDGNRSPNSADTNTDYVW
jgi:hypothetical protein